MKKILVLAILLLIITTAVNMNKKTDRKAFINGKIYTVNQAQPYAEAVVIEKGKIIYVGSTAGAEKIIDNTTEIYDLEGKLMLPGFIDSHLHFISGGNYTLGINLRAAKSREQFVQILKNYIRERNLNIDKDKNITLSDWITGGRWDHESWSEIILPTKDLIDSVTGNVPVFVSRIDGHMGLANSKALELAGINKNTPDPEGGIILRNPGTGEPNGILKDKAMDLVFNIIPPPTIEDNIKAALKSLELTAKLGITSVHDMTQPGELEAYQELLKEGKLTCRIYSIWPLEHYEDLVYKGITAGNEKGIISRGALKGYADGSLGAFTAWFFEPYAQDPSTSGLPMENVSNGNMEKWVLSADRNRLQICIHAIGDRANSYVLDLFEKAKNENPPWERRFRIEHAQHLRVQDIPRFGTIPVIASVQPYHCIDDGVWVERRIGKDRTKTTHAYKSLLDAGSIVAFGTDWPVAPLDPLLSIYAAVTRRTIDGKNPDGWLPEQKLSVEDAIKCYTINGAYASFEENEKGSIEKGKYADLIVLSDDILSIDPVKIKDVKVEMTVFNGNIIYRN
ncbi:MAG: amidohydrolase [Ignavibacteriaceae bacterium]